MAINFPSSPADGEEYTDPNSGTWVYDIGTNSWTLTTGGSTSAFNFRGGHDFRQSTPPAEPIESGDMWIHDAADGTIDAVYTGISGQIGNGQLVLWDGSSYVMVSGTVPGYPDVGDGEGGTLDSRYLKLGANAGAQNVLSPEKTTFEGRIQSRSLEVVGAAGNVSSMTTGVTGADTPGKEVLQLVVDSLSRISINKQNIQFLCDDTEKITGLSHNEFAFIYKFDAGVDGNTYAGIKVDVEGNANLHNIKQVYGVFAEKCEILQNANVEQYASFANSVNSQDKLAKVIGYKGVLNKGSRNNYNFYAEGNATNYLKGRIITGNEDNYNMFTQKYQTGLSVQSWGGNAAGAIEITSSHTDNAARKAILFTKATAGTGPAYTLAQAGYITILDSVGAAAGIEINGGTNGSVSWNSDYRLKSNIVSIADASSVIKSLNPVNYTIAGISNVNGFIAHELQEHVPQAVRGSKDATEVIGTLTEYDGTVIQTDVTEPEELEFTEPVVDEEGVTTQVVRTRTWTETGTRPVYQGVDQTKLIPLLTKALQEALERIEALEAAATSSGY